MSSKNNNQLNIPRPVTLWTTSRCLSAQEVDVNLTNGYNGHLTSREACDLGGQMVKKMCPK